MIACYPRQSTCLNVSIYWDPNDFASTCRLCCRIFLSLGTGVQEPSASPCIIRSPLDLIKAPPPPETPRAPLGRWWTKVAACKGRLHQRNPLLNQAKLNRIRIVITLFRMTWHQSESRLFQNQSCNGKYNLIPIELT